MISMRNELEVEAASLLCVGFQGQGLTPELEGLFARGVRGVILFSRNVGEAENVFELTRSIKMLAAEPIVVAVDQEGGQVQRLRRGFTELPPLRALGATREPELAVAVGRLLGSELRAVGIDWNFAPVLDVDTNPNNPVIGPRAFGAEPALVAELGVALAAGLASAGVAACGKHFPGHGDTELDSHLALPRVDHDWPRLEQVELLPFRAAIRAEIPALMTAHVVFSPLDAELPATLSAAVITGLLRTQLGYEGVVVSDDLEMKSIVDHFGIDEAIVRGVAAGVDQFLVCHSATRMHAAIDALIHAVESGELSRERLRSASQRLQRFRARWAAPPAERFDAAALRKPEHLALAERLAAGSTEGFGPDPTEPRKS